MKKMLFLALVLVAGSRADAQILKRIADRTKQKAEDKVTEKVSNAATKPIDDVGTGKDKDKKKKEDENKENNSSSGNNNNTEINTDHFIHASRPSSGEVNQIDLPMRPNSFGIALYCNAGKIFFKAANGSDGRRLDPWCFIFCIPHVRLLCYRHD